MFNVEEIVRVNNNWITIVFIAVLTILVVLNIFFGKRLLRTNSMLLNKSYVQIYYNKDKGKFFALVPFLFFIVQIFAISLLLYLFMFLLNTKNTLLNFNGYLLILGIVSGYLVLRYLTGFLLATLFELKTQFYKLLFEKTNYLSNVILWVLPILLLSSYITFFKFTMVKITLSFFIILLIFRYVLILINNKKLILNNLFYFILYICALEIAPLILIIKLTI